MDALPNSHDELNPPGERFRRRSFIAFAIVAVVLLIGFLEMKGPDRFSKEIEDGALLAAAQQNAQMAIQTIGWAVVCNDREAAANEAARLESFMARGDYKPSTQEGIVEGCYWEKFAVHRPISDADLPPLHNIGGRELPNVHWYHGEITFESGPKKDETLPDAFTFMSDELGSAMKRPVNPE